MLCDCGNTNIKFSDLNSVTTHKITDFIKLPKEKFYYISVNFQMSKNLISTPNAINLAQYIDINSTYVGMGDDRSVLCSYITDGVIVDAGSAVTIDVMNDGVHQGGYILSGVKSYEQNLISTSDALKCNIKYSDLSLLPQNTSDALSFGYLKSIVLLLEQLGSKQLYFTGGDGELFSKYFVNSTYDKDLIFKAMESLVYKIKK